MRRLYRAMKQGSQGMPELGESARTLGIRPGIDVLATRPTDPVPCGQGGLSVSPDDPMGLPVHRRPVAFQGTGRDPVWSIEEKSLGSDLAFRSDPGNARHGFIEPARTMTLNEFQHALRQTESLWQRVDTWPPTGGSCDGD